MNIGHQDKGWEQLMQVLADPKAAFDGDDLEVSARRWGGWSADGVSAALGTS